MIQVASRPLIKQLHRRLWFLGAELSFLKLVKSVRWNLHHWAMTCPKLSSAEFWSILSFCLQNISKLYAAYPWNPMDTSTHNINQNKPLLFKVSVRSCASIGRAATNSLLEQGNCLDLLALRLDRCVPLPPRRETRKLCFQPWHLKPELEQRWFCNVSLALDFGTLNQERSNCLAKLRHRGFEASADKMCAFEVLQFSSDCATLSQAELRLWWHLSCLLWCCD